MKKETGNIRKNESEMKTTITKMMNTLEGINRLDKTEDSISEIEDKVAKHIQSNWQKDKNIF